MCLILKVIPQRKYENKIYDHFDIIISVDTQVKLGKCYPVFGFVSVWVFFKQVVLFIFSSTTNA